MTSRAARNVGLRLHRDVERRGRFVTDQQVGIVGVAMAITTRWRSPPENSCGNTQGPLRREYRPGQFHRTPTSGLLRNTGLVHPSMASAIWSPTVWAGDADIGSWNTVPIALPRGRDIADCQKKANDSVPCGRTEPHLHSGRQARRHRRCGLYLNPFAHHRDHLAGLDAC